MENVNTNTANINAREPYVSVIIPVFNDADRLDLCLDALNRQTYNRSRVEIVVIDNGSDSLETVRTVVKRHKVDVFAVELTPGSYAARNRGIGLARGEIIAFTDADCIPAWDWLTQGVTCITTDPQCDMVIGEIESFAQNANRPNLLERYQMVTAFPQESYWRQGRGGATANIMTRRVLFDRVGLFVTHLKSGGDLDWGRRVYLAGYRQHYAPLMKVRHPARHTWAEMNKKNRRIAGGIYDRYIKPDDSWVVRQYVFVLLILGDLFPPRQTLANAINNPRETGCRNKLEILFVMFTLRYLAAVEKLKLHFQGMAIRQR